MNISSILIPRFPLWLLRIASAPESRAVLLHDAVAFASWYSPAHDLIDWPDEVRRIQAAQDEKKLTLEHTLKLLSGLGSGLSGKVSAARAKVMLEGYEVHGWLSRHAGEFSRLLDESMERLQGRDETIARIEPDGSESFGLNELAQVLGISELELDILGFIVLCAIDAEVRQVVQHFTENRRGAEKLWETVFNRRSRDIEHALRPGGTLRLCGLLTASGNKAMPAQLSPFWLNALVSGVSLFDALLEPIPDKPGSGVPARLHDEDLALAAAVIRNADGAKGVNLLLYGAPALDKRLLLKKIVEQAGRSAYRVKDHEEAHREDRPSMVYVSQKLLAQKGDHAVLVVEKPADALASVPSAFLREMFGLEVDVTDARPFDQNLLASNAMPCIWLAASPDNLPAETISRFVFHAPLKKADKRQREHHLRQLLADCKLSKRTQEAILKLDGVSVVQIESAQKAARLANARSRKDREHAVLQAIRRSQKALGRDLAIKFKSSVTQYSLDYLNTSGRFTPQDILLCLQNRPRGSLLFYGPPGTGKTQFVEHMAQVLGMPIVAKRASDLLSKWLGDTEKALSAAFEEAASEDAILFLDEGDSFLRDREMARESWQVTQVNELLQHIERYEGIVVVCTNHFRGLDGASLRRFTFKVEFRELSAEQRWQMFQAESGIKARAGTAQKETHDVWRAKLARMEELTAGDFATVKRQSEMLGLALSPEEWLEQLQLECEIKRKDNARIGFV